MILPIVYLLSVGLQETPRIEAIWDAVETRVVRQVDRWYNTGDFPRVVQLLRFRAEMFPADEGVWTDLGWMLENIKENDEALKTYKRFRLANPSDPDAPYPEAFFYARRKEFDKIPELLEPTIEHGPHANNFRTLAHAYEKLGKLADAKRVWDRYLMDNPDDQAAIKNRDRIEKRLLEQDKGPSEE